MRILSTTAEQQCIVAKLDAALLRLMAAKAKLASFTKINQTIFAESLALLYQQEKIKENVCKRWSQITKTPYIRVSILQISERDSVQ